MEDAEFLEQHRRVWAAKPNLRRVYRRYHDWLLDACPKEARILELGSGIGTLAERARERGYTRFIPSDILVTGSARLRCDATRLPFVPDSLDRIICVDVLHHLAAPLEFFQEAARALNRDGAIICVEPWITAASWPVYRFIHQEGCDLSRDVEAPFACATSKPAYEGDNAIATLLCRHVRPERWRAIGFAPPVVRPFNDFAYLTTRGLREGRDAPGPIYSGARVLDRLFGSCARLLGMRAIIEWRRA